MRQLNNIAVPGVAEEHARAVRLRGRARRGARISVIEWPDAELAWRAISSVGPAVPALRTADVDAIKRDVLAALETCRDERGIYRSGTTTISSSPAGRSAIAGRSGSYGTWTPPLSANNDRPVVALTGCMTFAK